MLTQQSAQRTEHSFLGEEEYKNKKENTNIYYYIYNIYIIYIVIFLFPNMMVLMRKLCTVRCAHLNTGKRTRAFLRAFFEE